MSIKSDRWIRQQCLEPKYVRIVNGVARGLPVPPSFEDSLAIQHCERNKLDRPLSPAEVEMIVNRGMVLRYDDNVQSMYPWLPMIEPFAPMQIREKGGGLIDPPADEPPREEFDFEMRSYRAPLEKIISYGTSSYGYDIRCSREFKVFTNINSTIVDPKNFDEKSFVDMEGDYCIIPPNSFALARTMEYFRIPRDVLTICLGKSTYARCGIVVNVTPFEPEWEGHVTLEFSNTTPLPAKIYAGEGCAQVLFFQGDEPCEVSYKDRGGKYQGQTGVVTPRT